MIPHPQILGPVSFRLVARLVERHQNMSAGFPGAGREGIPFLGHRPFVAKAVGDRAFPVIDHHPALLELRRTCVANKTRADQRIDIPVPEIARIAARAVEGRKPAAPCDIRFERWPLRQGQHIVADIVPDDSIELGEVARIEDGAIVVEQERPVPPGPETLFISSSRRVFLVTITSEETK